MPGPYVRDPSTLDRLTIVQKWQLTRRHPYYLRLWQAARAYSADPATSAPEGAWIVAFLKVRLGWEGEYCDPATDEPWHLPPDDPCAPYAGLTCAFPMTPRDLMRELIVVPLELRQTLARILLDEEKWGPDELGEDDTAKAFRRQRALNNLPVSSVLDAPIRGLVKVYSLDAPLRGVHEDIEKIVKTWGTRGPEKRRTGGKVEDYLKVWDLREGWAGGKYDAAEEKRLKDVAISVGVELPTVQARYKSAFRLITGQPYTAELWFDLFAPLKLSRWASWRRSKPHSGSVKTIAASRLRADPARNSVLTGAPDPQSGTAFGIIDLKEDIRSLSEKGKTDQQIAVELECSAEIVNWLLGRIDDRL
jgi:hypothetical protein